MRSSPVRDAGACCCSPNLEYGSFCSHSCACRRFVAKVDVLTSDGLALGVGVYSGAVEDAARLFLVLGWHEKSLYRYLRCLLAARQGDAGSREPQQELLCCGPLAPWIVLAGL